MLETVAIVFVVLILAVLIYAATKPNSFHVERSISIKASPEKIFAFVDDFHQWNDWTPYNKDPSMKKTYSGSVSGKGAMYAWEGNKEVGKGEITITGTTPPNKVEMDLHMIKPFEGHNVATFTLAAAVDSTNVTWSLDDKHKLMVKVIGLFLNLDKMIGRDFEAGLAKLKTVAEK